MRYDVEVGGRRRQVVVMKTGDGFAVTVDGTTHHVDLARISGHTLSLIVDRVWPADASMAPDPSAGQMTVHVGGMPVVVGVNGRGRYGRKTDGAAGAGPQRLAAPMPGKVVRVLAKTGDSVRARQPVYRRQRMIFGQVRDPLVDAYVGQHVQTWNDHPHGY